MSLSSIPRGLALALTAAFSVACGDGPVEPQVSATSTVTVDAAASTAYIAFANNTANLVTVPDAGSSTAWDLSFLVTTVAPNANAGVSVHCLCANAAASNDAVMAMTPAGQLAAFEAVTAADIPASSSFAADVFTTQRWYRYNLTGSDNQIWPVFNVYLIKRGTTVYKVQLINYYSASGAPRHITFRYAKLRD